MEAVTKASQIMSLHAQGLSTREIALAVYGEATDSKKAYVRIVVGQRKGSRSGPADKRYRSTEKGRATTNTRVQLWHAKHPEKVRQWASARYRRKKLSMRVEKMDQPSKAERIRTLYAAGKATRDIAKIVFETETPTQGNLAYVRVSGRQRSLGGICQADINWRTKRFGSLKAYYDHQNIKTKPYRDAYYRDRYHGDPEYRDAKLQYNRRVYHKKKLSESLESA